MKIKYILSFAAAVLLLAACTKHKGDFEEYVPTASLTLISPVGSSTYRNGDSLIIQGVAISTDVIHGYDITVNKANDTTALFFMNVHDHNDTLNINQKWKINVTVPANLEARVKLYLDHNGHTLIKKSDFKVQ